MVANDAPIGMFDSGVGGLSVLKAIRDELPQESVIYIADQAHVPYGSRSLEEVCAFSGEITKFLLHEGAKIIVVACNTASAAALEHLRNIFPKTSFVGMEPAIKPAATSSKTRIIGVLATPATFQGRLYSSVVERFGKDVTILQDTCPGLVAQIESGKLDSSETRRILENALLPMVDQRIDTVVLGCTHYPFIIPMIRKIIGPDVQIIDPSPAVARQTARLLDSQGTRNHVNNQPNLLFYTSGVKSALSSQLPKLFGERENVEKLSWNGNDLLTVK